MNTLEQDPLCTLHPEPESQTFFSMVGYQLDDGSQIFKIEKWLEIT